MKLIVLGLILAGFACLAFAAWGIYTPMGRSKFEEMDGIYPYLSDFVGWLLIGAAVVMHVLQMRDNRRDQQARIGRCNGLGRLISPFNSEGTPTLWGIIRCEPATSSESHHPTFSKTNLGGASHVPRVSGAAGTSNRERFDSLFCRRA